MSFCKLWGEEGRREQEGDHSRAPPTGITMEAESEVRFDWSHPEIAGILSKAASFSYAEQAFWYAACLTHVTKGGQATLVPWADVADVRRQLELVKGAARRNKWTPPLAGAQQQEPRKARRVLTGHLKTSTTASAVAPLKEMHGFAEAVRSLAGEQWSPPFDDDPRAAPRFVRYLRAMVLSRRRLIRGADHLDHVKLFIQPARRLVASPPPLATPEESVAAARMALWPQPAVSREQPVDDDSV